MAKLSKKQKEARAKVDSNAAYTVADAAALVKDVTTTKFDASVDLAVRLGVDPKKSEPNGQRRSDPSSRDGKSTQGFGVGDSR